MAKRAYSPKAQRRMVGAAIATVFVQQWAKDAHARRRVVSDQLRDKTPRAHWLRIHSTNPLERLNAEIKRRTKVVGIFRNDRAISRLVGAMLLEQSDEWTLQRRYMQQLKAPPSLSDTARLSAVTR